MHSTFLLAFSFLGGRGGVHLSWAIFAKLHGGCNKCPGGGNLASPGSFLAVSFGEFSLKDALKGYP